MSRPAPRVNIRFIYQSCNDIAAMRRFYTDALGMQEAHYKEGPEGWLVYQCEGFQFMLFPSSYPMLLQDGFAQQPGWEGGILESISWSVAIPEADYAETIARVRESGAEAVFETPQWQQDSYWSYPVRDPMGNTVEVYCNVAVRPTSTTWGG
ncbi:VOC family protein [bacterium]|nr:VOC family protein [bacterium]